MGDRVQASVGPKPNQQRIPGRHCLSEASKSFVEHLLRCIQSKTEYSGETSALPMHCSEQGWCELNCAKAGKGRNLELRGEYIQAVRRVRGSSFGQGTRAQSSWP